MYIIKQENIKIVLKTCKIIILSWLIDVSWIAKKNFLSFPESSDFTCPVIRKVGQ